MGDKPYYANETHAYCRACKPPRRIFVGLAQPVVKDGKRSVQLSCPLHGHFWVAEESLHSLRGATA